MGNLSLRHRAVVDVDLRAQHVDVLVQVVRQVRHDDGATATFRRAGVDLRHGKANSACALINFVEQAEARINDTEPNGTALSSRRS